MTTTPSQQGGHQPAPSQQQQQGGQPAPAQQGGGSRFPDWASI